MDQRNGEKTKRALENEVMPKKEKLSLMYRTAITPSLGVIAVGSTAL